MGSLCGGLTLWAGLDCTGTNTLSRIMSRQEVERGKAAAVWNDSGFKASPREPQGVLLSLRADGMCSSERRETYTAIVRACLDNFSDVDHAFDAVTK
jgi:hypothetical protein